MNLDLREFAGQILETAKENLSRDGCLLPVAFVVTPEEVLAAPLVFEGQEEKEAAYRGLVEMAKEKSALAIITLNDAHYSASSDGTAMETYYPGKLAAEKAPECILLTVSGPGIQSWQVMVPYERKQEGINFLAAQESANIQLALLGDWSSSASRPS